MIKTHFLSEIRQIQVNMKIVLYQPKRISDSPNNSFSILVERLYTLQNFLLSEISDIKAEMKKKCNQMASKEISAGNDKKLSFCKIK